MPLQGPAPRLLPPPFQLLSASLQRQPDPLPLQHQRLGESWRRPHPRPPACPLPPRLLLPAVLLQASAPQQSQLQPLALEEPALPLPPPQRRQQPRMLQGLLPRYQFQRLWHSALQEHPATLPHPRLLPAQLPKGQSPPLSRRTQQAGSHPLPQRLLHRLAKEQRPPLSLRVRQPQRVGRLPLPPLLGRLARQPPPLLRKPLRQLAKPPQLRPVAPEVPAPPPHLPKVSRHRMYVCDC